MKSKTRRKMTFRRFAYYLLITAIVVSCVTNGIFAKFTTEDDGGDGARVAKFGIVLSVAGDLFSTTYNEYAKDGEGNETANSNMPAVFKQVDTDDGISVQAHYKYVLADRTETDAPSENATYSFNNVVAPGTKNDEGINISIQGTAETDCVISYEIAMETIFLRNVIPENGYTMGADGFHFSYIESEGDTDVNYCVMVPVKDNIIRADNFEEFLDSLYIKNTDNTYSRATVFSENDDYYQAEDIIDVITDDYYMPIIYFIEGTSSLSGIENMTMDKWEEENYIPILGESIPYGYMYNELGNAKGGYIIDSFVDDIVGGAFLTGEENIYTKDTEDVFPYKCVSKGKSDIIETGTPINIDFNLKWLWEYTDEEETYNDQADTILGHLMAGNDVYKTTDDGANYVKAVEGVDYNLDIAFDINITINQVD